MLVENYVCRTLTEIEDNAKEKNHVATDLASYLNGQGTKYQQEGLSPEEAGAKVRAKFGDPATLATKVTNVLSAPARWLVVLLLTFSILHLALTIIGGVLPNAPENLKEVEAAFIIWFLLTVLVICSNVLFYLRPFWLLRWRGFFFCHCLLSAASVAYTLPLFIGDGILSYGFLSKLFIESYLVFLLASVILGAWLKPLTAKQSSNSSQLRLMVIISNTISGILLALNLLLMGLVIVMFGTGSFPGSLYWQTLAVIVLWFVSLWLNKNVQKYFYLGLVLQVLLSLFIIITQFSSYG